MLYKNFPVDRTPELLIYDGMMGKDANDNETPSPVSLLFEHHLHLVAPDGVLQREYLPALKNAQLVVSEAQEYCALLRQQAQDDAAAIRSQAQNDGAKWLANEKIELFAQMCLQQTELLEQLQPFWMQALERTVRQLCSTQLRPDVLAAAIETGIKEFKDLSELCIAVHPQDLGVASAAVARLKSEAGLIKVDSDAILTPGTCRLRNTHFEVTLNLDRAIDLAFSKS